MQKCLKILSNDCYFIYRRYLFFHYLTAINMMQIVMQLCYTFMCAQNVSKIVK